MSLYSQFRKVDSFSTPVATINLKGEEMIRTIPGALITICTYTFLLYVATQSFIEMIGYQNNKIQSYDVDLPQLKLQEVRANMHE